MNTHGCCDAQEVAAKKSEDRLLTPRADIVEDALGVTLWLDLPGVDESSLELTVEKDLLTVTARRELPLPEGVELKRQEIANGLYRRSFTLSDDLDGEKIDAELNNGVLTKKS